MASLPVSSNSKPNTSEHLPVQDSPDLPDVNASLISSGRSSREYGNGYYTDHVFAGTSDNPYAETTESDLNLRCATLSEVIPRPWQSYQQIKVASFISIVMFLFTGIFAVKFAYRAQMHQSKGLMGMAQHDLRMAVRLIYASIGLGFLLYCIVIPVAAS